MKIEKVYIKNFRAISECDVHLEEILALVGENNSGKSSFIRALNSFFNYDKEKKWFDNDEHKHKDRARPTIQITFSDVTDFEEMVNDGKMVIQVVYVNRNGSTSREIKFQNIQGKFEPLRRLSIDEFFERINSTIQFIIVPINRTGNELEYNHDTILKLLIDASFEEYTANRDLITPDITRSSEKVISQLNKISKVIEDNYPLDKNFSVKLNLSNELNYKVLLENMEMQLIENSKAYSIHSSGSGIQSLISISIYSYLARKMNRNIILAIEEPETNLHPQAQSKFIKYLKEINSNQQVILTTHSTTIIDQLAHTEIVLFRKDKSNSNVLKTMVTQLPKTFWEDSNLLELKAYKFYKFKNSEFFFSKFVLLVESSTDAEVIDRLISKSSIDNKEDITILNLDGVKNLKYPLHLLKGIGIPYILVVDKDFFLRYSATDNKKDDSRDYKGFFTYDCNNFSGEITQILDVLIPESEMQQNLLLSFQEKKHQKSLSILEQYNIVVMRWCLEMDIIGSTEGCKLMCQIIGDEYNASRSTKKLLIQRKNKIKNLESLLHVVNELPKSNYPRSFSQVIKMIIKLQKSLN